MLRLIIADAHVGQRVGDAEDMMTVLARAADMGCSEIVYLGDAFQYLFGMEKFWTETIRAVLARWGQLRDRGMRVVLVEGNRDFFLDEPDIVNRIDWGGRLYEFAAEGLRYRLVHGDKVNRRDLQYLFWSQVSKSSVARLCGKVLPRQSAVSIVRSAEARLARTNRRFRYRLPVGSLRRSADRAWASGVDVLLFGHFHRFWECHGQGRKTAMVIPAWLECRCALLVESTGQWCFVDQRLEPCEPPDNNEGSG